MTDVLNKGPIFCVEPRMKAPDLLSVASGIRDNVQEKERDACLTESQDYLLRFSPEQRKVTGIRREVSHLIEHDLRLITADKEGFLLFCRVLLAARARRHLSRKSFKL